MTNNEKTENVFEGKPDSRQEGDIQVSRFRPRYRALSVEEKQLHDDIKAKAQELEALLEKVKALHKVPARYKALAFTALEESIMWGIKALTS